MQDGFFNKARVEVEVLRDVLDFWPLVLETAQGDLRRQIPPPSLLPVPRKQILPR